MLLPRSVFKESRRTGGVVDHVQRTMINNIARAAPRSIIPARVAANLNQARRQGFLHVQHRQQLLTRPGQSHARRVRMPRFLQSVGKAGGGRILLPFFLGARRPIVSWIIYIYIGSRFLGSSLKLEGNSIVLLVIVFCIKHRAWAVPHVVRLRARAQWWCGMHAVC